MHGVAASTQIICNARKKHKINIRPSFFIPEQAFYYL
jgi:hypothetical protein